VKKDAKPSEPVRLGQLMTELLRSVAGPRRKEMSALDEAWYKSAGAATARRSRPVGLKGGELTVSFETSALRQEVECFRKAEILARLRDAYPEAVIAKLRCVIRRVV
jgi:hypothetical protein